MLPDQKIDPRAMGRLQAVDLARGLALVAMAVYHFTWDLEFFGYVPPGMTGVGGWKIFARCIAASFLFLVGVSLVLAHGRGIRWHGFWRRLAMVGGAALAISAATYLAMPETFIFFGILHQIALASVLGLAFLRLPPAVTILVAAGIIAAPFLLRSEVFDHPALWWVGLSATIPRSNDYVPLFPWFGPVLMGMAAGRIGISTGVFARLAEFRFGTPFRPLFFIGRHSLAFYLVHQPVLIGSLWLFSQLFPAQALTDDDRLRYSCQATCQQTQDESFCTRYCACMRNELDASGDLPKLFQGREDAALRDRISVLAGLCTGQAEDSVLKDTAP
jgi:uncharacterized membrane protein